MTRRLSSVSVHAGENRAFRSMTTPIVQASTYYFRDMEEVQAFTEGEQHHYEYGRYDNPTREAAEKKLAELEGGERCLLFDSGMSAITATILAYLESGDHMVLTDDVYKQTMNFAETVLPRFNIEASIVPVRNYDAMEAAIGPRTKLFLSESPTNPYLNVMDLERINEIGKKTNVITVIDSTFATPFNQQPLSFGIDIVIHSATKYLGGHNDLLIGTVIGQEKVLEPVREFQRVTGGIPDPFACYLLLRGLKTCAVRMQRYNSTAMEVAKFLNGHPKVRRIYYPGLPNHRNHEVATRQMKGFGGVVTIEIEGGWEETRRFLDSLRLSLLAPSFGGPETLVYHPATMSYYSYTREEKLAQGILDELVRIAVGMEEPEDIIADLEAALKNC